jgi:hypothetical protein
VDKNNCTEDYHATKTTIFASEPESNLHYSYSTCGNDYNFASQMTSKDLNSAVAIAAVIDG